jgi:very-short-patch-repair endonuclease
MRTASARRLRSDMTDAEQALWHLLRNRRLHGHKFRRQFLIGPYIADYICLEARLIVEADGGQHTDSTLDASRTEWLQGQRFRVLRFWNNDILANPDGVLTELLRALAEHGGDVVDGMKASP